LAVDVARNPVARGAFTRGLKEILAVSGKSSTGTKDGARGEAIRLVAQLLGAMILARAVDDSELSDEILEQTRAGL
jgi:TetR/AcrR family transcriptional regulator, transcriptional repressor for nem operon